MKDDKFKKTPHNFSVSAMMPKIETPNISSARNYYLADYKFEVIKKMIKDFEDKLDNEHEVALKLATFGQSILLNVTSIGYVNPSTIVFHGFVDGQPATLIQHMTMLNFLLISAPVQDTSKPPRRIGFFESDGDVEN